ncbi:hypothetical protein MPTK1_6g08700 [Marchantia polymorpha subsp. ruderalis]|uniref:Uncharacterized protein n=2 Tax=Marchantia polymorpha TaxID=3197 RepID=A0AAF6BPZ7_MARPO|nr:hypothetical protein MARPO_0060s0051 [Marchantia polymorpha]BBN14081.1 hypothetical protein Mp_6g08700 [Marchantia polymorpha subsp. ruderalis]|eukprot:PTQ36964.1 hypothetical protein MARPO_0060s0051 [Marchantia polymorpha]
MPRRDQYCTNLKTESPPRLSLRFIAVPKSIGKYIITLCGSVFAFSCMSQTVRFRTVSVPAWKRIFMKNRSETALLAPELDSVFRVTVEAPALVCDKTRTRLCPSLIGADWRHGGQRECLRAVRYSLKNRWRPGAAIVAEGNSPRS